MSTAALEPRVSLRRQRLEAMLKVLDVDGAVRRVRGGWQHTGQPWTYDTERYARVAETRRSEQQAMLDYVSTTGCRMAFLRDALDDPELVAGREGHDGGGDRSAWRCERCDRCDGATHDELPDEQAVARARDRLAVPGAVLPARRQWPSGMAAAGVALSGRIAADERAEEGRAVARLDGLGWGGMLRELFASGPDGTAADGPLPPALRAPVTQVLDAWAPRVAGVVLVTSVSRPVLTEHLATGIARHLDVPVVGRVAPRDEVPAGRHDVNSAQRLAGVTQRLRLDLSPAAASGLAGRAVLLVDDRYDSGWTTTVAARLLRLAGASAVHPFVLGVG